MAVNANVVRTFDDGKVQVDVSPRRGMTYSYKLDADKADSFCSEYVKKTKRDKTINFVTMLGAIFGAMFGVGFINKKIDKKGLRILIESIAGIGIGGGWAVLASKMEFKTLDKVAAKYNAEEYEESHYGLPLKDVK